jgi:hypothetical protein
MELPEILTRFAAGLKAIDDTSSWQGTSARTGVTYLAGVPAMTERQLCHELVQWWTTTHPRDFYPVGTCREEVPYPGLSRARCDIVFSSHPDDGVPEWAVEVKRIQFIGDNGKKNDHNVQKMLSPYMKDRSLVHDIERMRSHPIAKRHAVLGYAFSYDYETCAEAERLHPEHADRIAEIRKVCKENDQEMGRLLCDEIVEIADVQFQYLGIVTDHKRHPIRDLWRHPCGGHGTVFGWEVRSGDSSTRRRDSRGNPTLW